MSDLTTFLREQLDADSGDVWDSRALVPDELHWSMPDWLDRDYLLRDVEAKRRITDELERLPHYAWDGRSEYGCPRVMTAEEWRELYGEVPQPCTCGRDQHVEFVLSMLVLPYSDRPGFRQEWAPE